MIYFIECKLPKGVKNRHKRALIKIGYTKNLDNRLRKIQTDNPFPLKVVFTLEGFEESEKGLHEYFKKCHVKGEWFRARPTIIQCIADAKNADIEVKNVQEFITVCNKLRLKRAYDRGEKNDTKKVLRSRIDKNYGYEKLKEF